MGKAGAAAVAPLIDMAKSEADEVVRAAALNSLAYLAGPEHARFANGLQPLLDNKDPEIALNTAIVLARIGGADQPAPCRYCARPSRTRTRTSRNWLPPRSSISVRMPSRPCTIWPDVLTNAGAPTLVRRNAALAIAHIGPAAKPVVPSVVQALKPSEPAEVRRFAAEAWPR